MQEQIRAAAELVQAGRDPRSAASSTPATDSDRRKCNPRATIANHPPRRAVVFGGRGSAARSGLVSHAREAVSRVTAGGREPHAEGAFARGTCSTDSASAMFSAVSKKAPPTGQHQPRSCSSGHRLQAFSSAKDDCGEKGRICRLSERSNMNSKLRY